MQSLDNYTDSELFRILERIWRRMTDGMGYQPFGFDAPTLWALWPDLMGKRRQIIGALKVRRL